MTAKLYCVLAEGELAGKLYGCRQFITEAEAAAGMMPYLIERMIATLPRDGADRLWPTWTCEPWVL